jgi:hypothetical protein
MERRQFFKNIGNLGALSAGAAALSVFSQQAMLIYLLPMGVREVMP